MANGILAAILSFIIPGLGQAYAGDIKKGIIFFIAAILIVVITELCTFLYFGILCCFGTPHITTALATLLGFLLLAAAYISFGILASSITENQIIAGVLTVGFNILTWFLPRFNPVFNNFSLINMYSKFPQGQIDIADTVTFITFTIACILLTLVVLQRRKSVR